MDIEKICASLRVLPTTEELLTAEKALYALQSENEKLRTEVKMWKCRCKEIVSHASELDMDLQNAEKENAELLAELKQVIHQRDNYHMYHYELALKPNCNTCADKDCKYRPIPGDTVRANCPLWRGSEEGEQNV